MSRSKLSRRNCPDSLPKMSVASACQKFPVSDQSQQAFWQLNWLMPISLPTLGNLRPQLAWFPASTAPAASRLYLASANAATRTCDDCLCKERASSCSVSRPEPMPWGNGLGTSCADATRMSWPARWQTKWRESPRLSSPTEHAINPVP